MVERGLPLMLAFLAALAHPLPGQAFDVKVSFSPVTQDTADQPVTIAQYVLHYGTRSRGVISHPSETSFAYDLQENVSNGTEISIPGLDDAKRYYFTVCAVDDKGKVSNYGNEVNATAPGANPPPDPVTPDPTTPDPTDPTDPTDPNNPSYPGGNAQAGLSDGYLGAVGCQTGSGPASLLGLAALFFWMRRRRAHPRT